MQLSSPRNESRSAGPIFAAGELLELRWGRPRRGGTASAAFRLQRPERGSDAFRRPGWIRERASQRRDSSNCSCCFLGSCEAFSFFGLNNPPPPAPLVTLAKLASFAPLSLRIFFPSLQGFGFYCFSPEKGGKPNTNHLPQSQENWIQAGRQAGRQGKRGGVVTAAASLKSFWGRGGAKRGQAGL